MYCIKEYMHNFIVYKKLKKKTPKYPYTRPLMFWLLGVFWLFYGSQNIE